MTHPVWPLFDLRVVTPLLELRYVDDELGAQLGQLAARGIHDPAFMPFAMPWTLAEPSALPADMIRYFSGVRATFRPDKFDLLFAVRVAGTLVGIQALHTTNFPIVRTGETGSWLGRSHQGRGIGTRMRRAVCTFAFDQLGAIEVTSGAFLDNPASLAVSRKVGYEPNGRFRTTRRQGEVAVNQRLVLTPDTFLRGEPIEVEGAAALHAFLGLDWLARIRPGQPFVQRS